MKINKKLLIICLAIPLLLGGLAALITGGGMESFERLNKPPLSPPGWLFPVVWTILYLLMGAASYLVLRSGARREQIRRAIAVYGLSLGFNCFWPVFFFGLSAYLFAFVWLIGLWLLILWAMSLFYGLSAPSGYLLLPYIFWVSFAGYLNFGIYLLN